MLFKDLAIYNRLWKIFDYMGFSLYNYKAAEAGELRLEGREGFERIITSLRGSIYVDELRLGERDIAYIPSGREASIKFDRGSVIYIAEAKAANRHPFYIKRFSDSHAYGIGEGSYRRRVYVAIGGEDPADSIIAGYVEGEKGGWTSYPPHRHDEKPEAYIFYNLGGGFGIQIIMDEERETSYIVRDYDVVLIPRGYHPNVCTSLAGCSYLWIISAPPGKRDLSVTIHPAFREIPMGRTHLKIRKE